MDSASPPPDVVGVLVVNLGTPDAPEPGAVRRYLRQFLSDPRVIDIPALPRWLLLNLVILPTRPRASAHAYAKIWTTAGSPLRLHGDALARGIESALGEGHVAELGMRYGSPSIAEALSRLEARGATRLVALPLYPHAASSSTGSTLEEIYRVLGARWNVPPVAAVPPFHSDEAFLEAWAAVLGPALDDMRPDHLVLSFHGLPERHVRKADPQGLAGCLASAGCCERLTAANRDCYRAQCFQTARLLARRLGRRDGEWSIGFQSRLGRARWIPPDTLDVLRALPATGARRVAVACPGFVADCLETLEEIGIRAKHSFETGMGGTELRLMPSLDAHPAWIRAAAGLVRRTAGG